MEKILVDLIDVANGEVFAQTEMPPAQLPDSFQPHSTLQLGGENWAIEEAIPSTKTEILKRLKLTLKLRKAPSINPKDVLFSLPTISEALPASCDTALFSDFEVVIVEDDWRQNEFLLPTALPLIHAEIEKIQEVKAAHSTEVSEGFTAYKQCHCRTTVGEPELKASLEIIQQTLNLTETGSLKMGNQFVENGFSLKTEATTFYGQVVAGQVSLLAVSEFSENSVAELKALVNTLGLLFVVWPHTQMIAPES